MGQALPLREASGEPSGRNLHWPEHVACHPFPPCHLYRICTSTNRTFTVLYFAFIQAYSALLRELRRYAQKGAYAQSGGSELPNTPFSF